MSPTVLQQLCFHNYSSLLLQPFNLWKHGYKQALNILTGSSCWCFIDKEGSLCGPDRLNLTTVFIELVSTCVVPNYSKINIAQVCRYMRMRMTIQCSIVTVPTQIVSILSIESNWYLPTSINCAFINFDKDPISCLMRLSYPAFGWLGSHSRDRGPGPKGREKAHCSFVAAVVYV